MTREPQNRLSRREILALRGLRLAGPVLRQLRQTGINCEPAISIEYQNLAKRYVIRGCESGGAAGQIGAYCSFVDLAGNRLEWLSRVDNVGRNGIHAVVIAPALVRIHMFRDARTCDLLITSHELKSQGESRRPRLENTIVFHGVAGTLPPSQDTAAHEQLPAFYTSGGEVLLIPERFRDAVQSVVDASRCVGCHHSHILKPNTDAAASQESHH